MAADQKNELDYIESRNTDDGLVAVVTLTTPIDIAGTKYTKLTLKEPKVRDMLYEDHLKNEKSYSAGKTEVYYFCSLIKEQPTPDDFQNMRGKDYARIQQGFLHLMA